MLRNVIEMLRNTLFIEDQVDDIQELREISN